MSEAIDAALPDALTIMDDGGISIAPEAPEAKQDAFAAPPMPMKRLPGRPKGTNYRTVDWPLHEEMRQLVERGAVPSITAAAMELAWRAYPPTSTRKARAKRLAATYPWPAANNSSEFFGNFSEATTPREAAHRVPTPHQGATDMDDAAGGSSTPKTKKASHLVIDTRSPYVGKISPAYDVPRGDRSAHFEWKGKYFDAHGREIIPGVPLPPEESDPDAGAEREVVSPDAEIKPAAQILAQIRDLPIARLRALAGMYLGDGNVHRTRQQIEVQLRELSARTKERRHPNSTRLARARAAAEAEAPVESVEVLDHIDA